MNQKIFIFIAVILGAVGGFSFNKQDKFLGQFLARYGIAGAGWENIPAPRKGEVFQPEPVKAPILVYHSVAPYYEDESDFVKKFDVTPEAFEKQLRYLKYSGYAAISLDDLADYFSGHYSLPEKPIILTFDDGWENQYIHAFPLLKKYNFTATFFVFTNAIGRRHFFTWDQLKQLADSGMAIGGHTKSHPYLFKITDKKELRQEIMESREILEKNLGKRVDVFAYPFGHYNQQAIETLKESGYRAARSDGYRGLIHNKEDLFTLKAIEAKNDFEKFKQELSAN